MDLLSTWLNKTKGYAMEEIKVSIIVPSYKRKKEQFARAIESLLASTYENIEIIVVDDNAKPEHAEYRQALSEYIAELNSDKVVYIQNETNLGGSGARNEGIRVATGEYITFLDDDDRYRQEKIADQLQFMLANNLDMSFTDLSIHNEKDKLIDYRNYPDLKGFDKDYLLRYHLTKQITGTPTFMCRKQILTDIGGFEKVPMGQEYYLMMRIINSGAKIGYEPQDNVVAYRTSQEAISTGPNKISGQKALFEYKKTYFNILSLSEKQYVRCRHYAVMAVAYKRNHKIFAMLWNLFVAVLCNPILAIKEAFGLAKKLNKKGRKND